MSLLQHYPHIIYDNTDTENLSTGLVVVFPHPVSIFICLVHLLSSLSYITSLTFSPYNILGLPLLAFPHGIQLNILLRHLLSHILIIRPNRLRLRFSICSTIFSSVFSRILLLSLFYPILRPANFSNSPSSRHLTF